MSFLCAEGVISCESLVAQYSMIWQTADRIHVTDQIEGSGPCSAVRRRCGDVLAAMLLVVYRLETEGG